MSGPSVGSSRPAAIIGSSRLGATPAYCCPRASRVRPSAQIDCESISGVQSPHRLVLLETRSGPRRRYSKHRLLPEGVAACDKATVDDHRGPYNPFGVAARQVERHPGDIIAAARARERLNVRQELPRDSLAAWNMLVQ